MARAALNWTVRDIADRAGVSHDTIVRIEGGDPTLKEVRSPKCEPRSRPSTLSLRTGIARAFAFICQMELP